MNEKPVLKVDWCDYKTAKFACEHWHYSHSLPASKRLMMGVWENGHFVGVVVYAWGANQHLVTAYGLKMTEGCELCRVALAPFHKTPVSKIVAISLKMLKRKSPGLRLVVSYADCDRGHHGGIYQAGNWVYVGKTQTNGGTPKFLVNGKVLHGRQVHSLWGTGAQQIEWLRKYKDPNAQKVYTKGKQKYLYPLDDAMRQQIEPLRQPYPKRASEVNGVTGSDQLQEGGSSPTQTLNLVELDT